MSQFPVPTQIRQVMPIVETGFSSANAACAIPVTAQNSEASSTVAAQILQHEFDAPLVRSLDDSPEIAAIHVQDSVTSEGESWML